MVRMKKSALRLIKLIKPVAHIVFLLYLNNVINKMNDVPVTTTTLHRFVPDMKHVLLWNNLDGFDTEGQRVFINNKCPQHNCYVTTNRSLFKDIRYFDALIFNAEEVSKGPHDLPQVRGTWQKYIFASNNSADIFPVCDTIFDDYFNWTWTYRVDSLMINKYFQVYNLYKEEDESNPQAKLLKLSPHAAVLQELSMKSKAATIFLDQCTSKSGKEFFIKDLQNKLKKFNLTIDVFGKCGPSDCKKRTMKPCFTKLKRFYYFYLALEDTLAEDYITDKVLTAYENNAVPIVYGKAAFESFLPPGSYIDGFTLSSTEVAQLMYNAIRDRTEYHKYFAWRKLYKIHKQTLLDPCDLCSKLNTPILLTTKVQLKGFLKWWNEKSCKTIKNSIF